MKRKILSLISLLISLLMLLGVFASCTENIPNEPEDSSSNQSGETEESSGGDKDESPDNNNGYLPDKEPSVVPGGDYSSLIHAADSLKNGITSYFDEGERLHYTVENGNMNLHYPLTKDEQRLLTIKNKNGNAYIESTMDVYIKMQSGDTFYSSESQRSAIANLYRYGYYYYDVHFYDQDFVNKLEITDTKKISPSLFTKHTNMSGIEVKDGVLYTTIESPYDPQIRAEKMKIDATKFNSIRITMKSTSTSTVNMYIIAGEKTSFSEDQRVDFNITPDGEYHTYIVSLGDGIVNDYTGTISAMRLDFNGAVGDNIEISEITAVQVSDGGAPNVRMDRNLHTYTDKMYQTIRLMALTEVNNIAEIGMVTRIAVDKVNSLVVKDKNGTKNTIDGIDWDSAEYIGFDIKDAGVFGYIMPDHAPSGKMTVTLEGDYYVILQTTVPENGTLKAPIPATSNTDKVVVDFVGTSIDPYHSESEFDFGQRIYTDDSHDLDKFVCEAEIERNPIPSENIVIDETKSPGSTYDGYDPLRGIYCFTVKENVNFHQGYYYQQNKHCPVSFKITGDDKDRSIYVLAYTFATSIECAAILDKNDMMLPIPLEVSKNFSNEFEEPIYAWGDIRYSEVRFPMVVGAGESQELTVLHLYQNWGQYPLKQLSSIQFFAPYYHLSTGCSESNCIASYYVYNKDLQTLPDHRAMSAPIWDYDPQHTQGGYHYWLQYTDSEGNFYASEDKINIIECAGPTYAEIDLTYLSDDGKIKVTYNHMEMPQTDENRTYYQMNYEVLEDVSFKDFSRDFSFYSAHGLGGNYNHIGYLDENNKSQIVDTGKDGKETVYKLGKDAPYFDMFEITEGSGKDDYVNLSFMIFSYDFTIGGQKMDPGFVIIDKNYTVRLSLDLGEVTLKKGDTFTINAILMPWGSQETNYNSRTPDKNVLDVIKYNIKNPLKVTPIENAEVIESVFLPKVKSTNGKSAEFTISGGKGNTTFRVYGFEKLTAPKLYELVEREVFDEDGKMSTYTEWVLVDVSSAYTPDSYGNAHTYDGYAVHYDSDGTYSYSFVTTMNGGNHERTFRVEASEDFAGWPEVEPFIPSSDVFFDHNSIPGIINTKTGVVVTEDGKKFVRIMGNGAAGEICLTFPVSAPTTGDILVIKYRIPTTNTVAHDIFQAYISTVSADPSDPNYAIVRTAKQDGEWHVMAIDLSEYNMKEFTPNADGSYSTKHLRLDIINTGSANPLGANDYIDIQYVSICKTLEEVAEMSSDMDYIDLVQGELLSNSIPVSSIGGGKGEADYFNLYFSADSLTNGSHTVGFGNIEVAEDKSYIRFFGDGSSPEGSIYGLYSGGTKVSGKYFVIKYRIPESNVENPNKSFFEFFTATSGDGPTGNGDRISTEAQNLLIKDGEWHVLILDVTSAASMTEYQPDANGKYCAAYIRFDVFNGQVMSENSYIDIAFLAVCEDPSEYEATLEGEGGGNTDPVDPAYPDAKYFDLYISAEELNVSANSGAFGANVLSEDGSYVSLYGDGKNGEAYFMAYANGNKVTGQYFVVKYRIPTTNAENPDEGFFEFFTSTVDNGPVGPGDSSNFASTVDEKLLIKDGEWHVFVLDVTTKSATCKTYIANDNGEYIAKFIRFDVFNQVMSTDSYIDIAFLAVCDDPSDYLATLESNQY